MFRLSSLHPGGDVRTKCQQNVNHTIHEDDQAMLKDIETALSRPQARLAQDALGLAALVVMLFVGLHLPLLA